VAPRAAGEAALGAALGAGVEAVAARGSGEVTMRGILGAARFIPSAELATSVSTSTGRVTARWAASRGEATGEVGAEGGEDEAPKGEGGPEEEGCRASVVWSPDGRSGRGPTFESSLGSGPTRLSPRGSSPALAHPASMRTWSAGPRRAMRTWYFLSPIWTSCWEPPVSSWGSSGASGVPASSPSICGVLTGFLLTGRYSPPMRTVKARPVWRTISEMSSRSR
jgi:hypothetical protein